MSVILERLFVFEDVNGAEMAFVNEADMYAFCELHNIPLSNFVEIPIFYGLQQAMDAMWGDM